MNQNYLLPLVLYSIVDNKHSPEVIITSNVITQFMDYNVIFHYDNSSRTKVDSIISGTEGELRNSYLIANHDENVNSWQQSIFTRPTGYKFLHIIFLQDYIKFERFTNTNNNSLQHADILFFVTNFAVVAEEGEETTTSNEFTFWEGNSLYKAGGLFIFDKRNLSLYTVCFYCGILTKTLQKIDGLSMVEDNLNVVEIPKLKYYINTFRNFNKHVFYVGYNIYKPLFYGPEVEKPGNHSVYDGHGIERELIVTLHDKLNMSCIMIPYTGYKNSWASVVNAVSRNILDWAISGITLTIPRTKIVDFTSRIRTEPYSILYALYDDPWLSWKNILLPFHYYIWITLTATIIVISCLLYVAVNFAKKEDDSHVTLAYFIQSWLRLLFEQSVPIMHNSVKSSFTTVGLMCLWFALALIINYSYKSKLTASLVNSKATEYDIIDQLVNRNYHFQLNDFDSTVLQENLQLSNDPKFLATLKRSSNNTEYCTALMKTFGSRVAMIDEATLMQNMVQEKCRQLMTIEEHEALRLISEDLFPSTHAWPMQLNTPYRVAFNKIILRLQDAGFFVKWNADYLASPQTVPKSHKRPSKRSATSFNLESLFGPAFIWIIGMCVATLVFSGELIRHRRR